MKAALSNLLRRVRVRSLVEGLMQTARIEGLPNESRDAVERMQDYGFAGNPVDGEGLRLEIGGYTILLRVDKLANRPQLAPYEVSVWHKDGHKMTMKAAGQVVVDCTEFIVNASASVAFNTPIITGTGNATFGGTVTGTTDVLAGGKSGKTHTHTGVQAGPDNTAGPA